MCFISPSYLSSLFKQDTGTTIVDYINSQRVDRAAVLLATTDRSIAAVAAAVGILDVNYFTKIFKKQLGTTPTQYRREKKAMLGHLSSPCIQKNVKNHSKKIRFRLKNVLPCLAAFMVHWLQNETRTKPLRQTPKD